MAHKYDYAMDILKKKVTHKVTMHTDNGLLHLKVLKSVILGLILKNVIWFIMVIDLKTRHLYRV